VKRKKRKIYIGKNEKEILRMVGAGLLVSASFAAPNLPQAFRDSNKKYTLQRSFHNVYDKNLILLSGEKVYLSKRGREMLEKMEVEEIDIQKEEWDGIWRIVSYDIPNELKKERDYFRKRLREWGFKDLQKSMLVIPYECKEEVAIFAQSLGISPYVIYLVTDKLPMQKKMEKAFSLDGSRFK